MLIEEQNLFPAVILSSIRTLSSWVWDKGWCVWGEGNFSVELNHQPTQEPKGRIFYNPLSAPLAEGVIIISTSGASMRCLKDDPAGGICTLRVRSDELEIILCPAESSSPTSELPAHLAVREVLKIHRPHHKAILHVHPYEVIALSQSSGITNSLALNSILHTVLPEIKAYLPEGIGFVPWLAHGSIALAEATAICVASQRVVVWQKHGIIATGTTLHDAFDAIDLVTKAARVALMVRQ